MVLLSSGCVLHESKCIRKEHNYLQLKRDYGYGKQDTAILQYGKLQTGVYRTRFADVFTVDEQGLRVLHLGRRVSHHTGVVAGVVAAEILDHQDAIVLVHLLDGHVLGGVDGAAVLTPVDGQRQVALHHRAGEGGPVAHVQLQDARLKGTNLRRHCKGSARN